MPTEWWLRPVSSAERVGEHSAVVWKRLYFSPSAASRSKFGVRHGPPKALDAPKPDVVDQHDQHVRRARRRPQRHDRRVRRVRILGVVGRQPGGRDVRDGQDLPPGPEGCIGHSSSSTRRPAPGDQGIARHAHAPRSRVPVRHPTGVSRESLQNPGSGDRRVEVGPVGPGRAVAGRIQPVQAGQVVGRERRRRWRRRSPRGRCGAWCPGWAPRRRPGPAATPAPPGRACTPWASATSRTTATSARLWSKLSPWKRGTVRRKSSSASSSRLVTAPVSIPRPSGLYGTSPMPSSRHVGTISSSMSRLHRSTTRSAGRRSGARRRPGGWCRPTPRTRPRWRTLPAATSSAMAPTVSSIGTVASGRCR